MENIRNLKVDFHNDKLTYKPGDTIVGCVSFKLTKDSEIDCVKIKFNGLANVHWTAEVVVPNKNRTPANGSGTPEQKDKPCTSRCYDNDYHKSDKDKCSHEYEKKELVTYDANEEWFHYQYVLMNNTKRDILKKGNHSYDFEFSLPKNIPGSLEHAVGNITYMAEATVEQLEGNLDVKQKFFVDQYLDLNADRSLLAGVGDSVKKEFCCDLLQCKKEPVIANFSIQRGGFVPGQAVLFNIIINNKNSRDITYICVGLYKHIIFKTPKQTKTVKIEVAECKINERVLNRSTRKFENQVLDIPSEAKPTNDLSKIIKTKYELVLRFSAGGFTTACECILPIVVGTERFECDIPVDYDMADESVISDCPPSYEEALRAVTAPSAPPEEDGDSWTNKLMFWK